MRGKQGVTDKETNKYLCPFCSGELDKRRGVFFIRQVGPVPGWVCEPCKKLYPSEEFIKFHDLTWEGPLISELYEELT